MGDIKNLPFNIRHHPYRSSFVRYSLTLKYNIGLNSSKNFPKYNFDLSIQGKLNRFTYLPNSLG